MSVGEIYRGARESVFTVEGREPGLGEWPEGPPRLDDGVATGTGFAIAGGRIVTNQHVVAGAELVTVRLGGRRVRARVVRENASSDLAILRLPRPALAHWHRLPSRTRSGCSPAIRRWRSATPTAWPAV